MLELKKSAMVMISIFLLILLTSCNKAKNEEAVPQFLDVKLTVNPEKTNMNDPIQFEAKVTYGDKKVKNADEVEFEIWRAKDESHEKIEVKHDHDGIYTLKKDFSKEGTYYVISHVTAEGMHAMPKKEFVIGTPSEPEEN
ncbi:FixH family protein [Bacillus massilinigeriensis]|uniref:FixH family protein n=1 Tax=Bacillus massilionigeriensis TaxID=1805475 RepID=UPI0028FCEA40|nr:FixH family protein [Bacillus massilionigeriensis]